MTLYKHVSGMVVSSEDYFKNIKCNVAKKFWFSINSRPEHPTHTFSDGKLVPLSPKELMRSTINL